MDRRVAVVEQHGHRQAIFSTLYPSQRPSDLVKSKREGTARESAKFPKQHSRPFRPSPAHGPPSSGNSVTSSALNLSMSAFAALVIGL